MLNFTVGPVMSDEDVLEVAHRSTPYFRTPEFSAIMLENERLFLDLLHAPAGSRAVFLTASGTGAMESCVMNLLNGEDRVIVVNGGSFGQRFVDLCALHGRCFTEVKCSFGSALRRGQLSGLEDHTALLINMCETSSGVLYDMPMVAEFCRENGIFLIVDAISAFLSEDLDMEALNAGAVLTGSQKALAVQPGVSLLALSPEAVRRAEGNPEQCLYLSLKQALKNAERGQTPFTPAVTTLLQIHARLSAVAARGGAACERAHIAALAADFRAGIADLPFETVSEAPSNTVTSLHPLYVPATQIVRTLKDEYGIWACPNGGALADEVFRIGHIGHIRPEDLQALLDALHDMNARGLLGP